jgi:hypothetical protein
MSLTTFLPMDLLPQEGVPLVFEAHRDLPHTHTFISPTGIWSLSSDFSSVSHSDRISTRHFDLTGLRLSEGDSVDFIDFIERDKTLFLSAIRKSTPTGFFVRISELQALPFPQVRSFALNSLNFHNQVLAAFTVTPPGICVVSREGVTIHDMALFHLDSIVFPVSDCCFSGSHLVLWSEKPPQLSLYELGSGKFRCCFESRRWKAKFPLQLLVLSHSFVLSSPDGLLRIPRGAAGQECAPIAISPYTDFKAGQLKFCVYDDALFVAVGRTYSLFDLADGDAIAIGEPSHVVQNFEGIYNSELAVADGRSFRIRITYDAIAYRPENDRLIAALFRRREGLSAAVALLTKAVRDVGTVQKLKELISAIGPSAKSPAAQIRFARAIQFSGLVNPHMVLLGLLHYRSVVGEMTEEAHVALFEAMFHPLCRYAMRDFFIASTEPFKKDALRLVMQRFGKQFEIPLEITDSIASYIGACEGFADTEQAAAAGLIARLDRQPT